MNILVFHIYLVSDLWDEELQQMHLLWMQEKGWPIHVVIQFCFDWCLSLLSSAVWVWTLSTVVRGQNVRACVCVCVCVHAPVCMCIIHNYVRCTLFFSYFFPPWSSLLCIVTFGLLCSMCTVWMCMLSYIFNNTRILFIWLNPSLFNVTEYDSYMHLDPYNVYMWCASVCVCVCEWRCICKHIFYIDNKTHWVKLILWIVT